MTAIVLSGSYPAGYTLADAVTSVRVTSSGEIGGDGVAAFGDVGVTLVNAGAIVAHAGETGVYLHGGGSLTNGRAKARNAMIEGGFFGVSLAGAGSVANFGVIAGKAGVGVQLQSAGVVTNFGTISGGGGVAVQFQSPGGVLVLGPASTLVGSAMGGGGALVLAGGGGALSHLFDPGGLIVSGTRSTTLCVAFDRVRISSGAQCYDTDVATTISVADTLIDNARLTLSGVVANAGRLIVAKGSLIVAAAGLRLSGSGAVILGGSGANAVTGATAASTLIVDQRLMGAGQLGAGALTLTIAAAGVVTATFDGTLIIDTGANLIANAGRIVSAGAGGATVMSALNNTGKLIATSGALTLNGAVTGAGSGQISAGVLRAASTFSENVAFTGAATGTLELAQSQGYAGTISGFSRTGANLLDLGDIAFNAGATTAGYCGTADEGVLSVTDGTHTARIHFTGDYTASAWVLASDGHGGTVIHDPAKATVAAAASPLRPAASSPRLHAFIEAMATAAACAGLAPTASPNAVQVLLAAPRTVAA